jgi:hypothetical protein
MEQSTVKIRDLGLASALVSCGHEISVISRDSNGYAYFIFLQTNELERAVNDYWSDTLDVKARTYSDAMKMLKSRIYGER